MTALINLTSIFCGSTSITSVIVIDDHTNM